MTPQTIAGQMANLEKNKLVMKCLLKKDELLIVCDYF